MLDSIHDVGDLIRADLFVNISVRSKLDVLRIGVGGDLDVIVLIETKVELKVHRLDFVFKTEQRSVDIQLIEVFDFAASGLEVEDAQQLLLVVVSDEVCGAETVRREI